MSQVTALIGRMIRQYLKFKNIASVLRISSAKTISVIKVTSKVYFSLAGDIFRCCKDHASTYTWGNHKATRKIIENHRDLGSLEHRSVGTSELRILKPWRITWLFQYWKSRGKTIWTYLNMLWKITKEHITQKKNMRLFSSFLI